MSGEGGIDDAAATKAETLSTRPRPPAPVAPGDPAPRVGRVVAVRKAYDRYLSVEQRDVEVDVAGAKVKGRELFSLWFFFSLEQLFHLEKNAHFFSFSLLFPPLPSLPPRQNDRRSSATTSSRTRGPIARS